MIDLAKILAFFSTSFGRIVLIMLSAAGLLFVGYQIKGAWGAIIAILIGILLYLYRQDLLSLL